MAGPIAYTLAFACAALCRGAAAQDSNGDAMVVIRKVGYPEPRVGARSACGQRQVRKGLVAPDYFFHVVVAGFREGTCAQIGYTKFEERKATSEGSLPFLGRHNDTYDVFSRDPTARDVAGCIGRECEREMAALGASHYMKDVAHCISPAFGPCVPKAWQCLGDDNCRSALQCLPTVARTCGADMWRVVTDPVERKKVACIWQCGNSTGCILERCGKVAIGCVTGADPLCHKALTCLPAELTKCSAPAFKCLLAKDGVCRDNLACLTKGAGTCADPALNVLTDTSISGLMTCANQRCPAPAGLPGGELQGLDLAPPAHFPEQLACMGLKCAGEVASLLHDKDLGAMNKCLVHGLEGCGEALWDCMGDKSCHQELQCWGDGIAQDGADLWKMVTNRAERAIDEELAACASQCYRQHQDPLAKALCIAGTCGQKALGCMRDATCRDLFTDLPKTVLRCGASLKDAKFTRAATCGAKMVEACGGAGIELVRDQSLAKIVTCNAQCTRPPAETAILV